MKNIFIPVLFLLVLFAGCSKENKEKKLTAGNLRETVSQAIAGDKAANDILQGLVDQKLPVNRDYNSFAADSFKTRGTKYYYVLLQYSNPMYNRFAVYDSGFNLVLLDKSLNGDLAMDFFVKDDFTFIKLVESFISKEALSVKRLSLYKVDPNSIKLAFRSFYSLSKPDAFFSQELSSVTKDSIVTEISVPDNTVFPVKGDKFVYSASERRYISPENSFDTIIKQQVRDFVFPASLPEIKDEKSAERITQEEKNK